MFICKPPSNWFDAFLREWPLVGMLKNKIGAGEWLHVGTPRTRQSSHVRSVCYRS